MGGDRSGAPGDAPRYRGRAGQGVGSFPEKISFRGLALFSLLIASLW